MRGRGELTTPICPSAEAGACIGPLYALVLNGSSLFADADCRTRAVHINFEACEVRTRLSLSSCPSDELSERRSCVELYVVGIDAEATGTGTYYDSTGAPFDVVIDDVELGLDDLNQESIRTGTLRGTFGPTGGESQPFVLSFSACPHPQVFCLR